MGDLIRKSELIETLHQKKSIMVVEPDGKHSVSLETVIDYIGEYPTVDAVPVVHAEWIDTQPEYHNGFHRNAHKCSNCGDYYTTEYDDLFFCPRCGAKMDGKKVQE